MTSPRDHSPRRYFVDDNGHRVLIGLAVEETFEFEALDNQPDVGDLGGLAAWAKTEVRQVSGKSAGLNSTASMTPPGRTGRQKSGTIAAKIQVLLTITE